MDAKLRLAFKKIFEKKISKEKYLDKQTEAAQKALEKVRKMKEARMFNISLYKYKGDIKGIKVVPKNPKTPVKVEEQPETNKVEEQPETNKVEEEIETPKEEPQSEQQPEQQPEEEIEEKDIPSETKPDLPLHDLPEDFIDFLMEEMKKADIYGKNVDIIESEEMSEPKPKRRNRKTNNIPQKRKNKIIEESLQQTPAMPQRVPKPVKPAPPRRGGRVLDQKYVYTESKLNNPEDISSLLPTGTPQPRVRRDYKNNKKDRLKAIQTITYLNK